MGDTLAVVLSVERGFQPEDIGRFHPGGGLGRKLFTPVADVMHQDNLSICTPEDTFRDVVHVMNRGRLRLALVMKGQELKGLITDGDVRRAFDSDHDYKALTAAQIISLQPKSVSPEMRFAEKEDLLHSGKINSLVVKDTSELVVEVL